jgi:hypothetical protein
MSVLTIAVLALAVVIVVLRTVARGRREPLLPPGDLEPTRATVDAQRAKPEPRTEPPEPAEPPVESTRPTIPPMVVEALASEPESTSEAAPAGVPALASVPAPAPAAVPAKTGADHASIEADDPERKKARKLARLFVSEIKLYNEKLVAEGLAAGDLYTRLKDPIEQSIVVFKRRVPEAVRADYIHEELVRQLAGGDESKLGAHYASLRRTRT